MPQNLGVYPFLQTPLATNPRMVTHPPRMVTHQMRSSALILKTTLRILMQQKAKLVYSMSRLRLATVCAHPPPFVIQLLKYLFETPFLQEYVIISPRSLRGRSWFLIGALVQHCIAIYSHLQPCSPMYSFVQPCTALIQPCTSLYSHVQLCTAMYNFVQPCTIFYSYVQLCTAMHGLVQHCISI